MVTKTYLNPTYLCDRIDSCKIWDRSDSSDSSDRSDQKTCFTKITFFYQKLCSPKKSSLKKIFHYFFSPKKSKCDQNQKLKMWQYSKTKNLIKLKNLKCDKTQKLQMWQNSEYDKTQQLKVLHNSKEQNLT